MKTLIKCLAATLAIIAIVLVPFTACDASLGSVGGSYSDKQNTISNANKLQANQPTPTDLEYSLERYNLIRRAYWVNGQQEKARNLPCEIVKPLGYVVLMTESGAVLGCFTVDGKVSSLNSFLTPDSELYEQEYGSNGYSYGNKWLADVDGSYGSNDNGIFFFTAEGNYMEWNSNYLYSDIPFKIDAPVLKVEDANE
jgi:hypothetical protein